MTKLKNTLPAALIIMVAWLGACGDKIDPLTAPSNGGNGGPMTATYEQDIKPILEQYCVTCHSSALSGAQRNGAPTSVNFDTYELAVANSERANFRISARTMPPGGELPSELRATFQEWVNNGTPRGEL